MGSKKLERKQKSQRAERPLVGKPSDGLMGKLERPGACMKERAGAGGVKTCKVTKTRYGPQPACLSQGGRLRFLHHPSFSITMHVWKNHTDNLLALVHWPAGCAASGAPGTGQPAQRLVGELPRFSRYFAMMEGKYGPSLRFMGFHSL